MSSEQAQGRIKAVVFDFDGVILESADIKTEAFADLFSDYTGEQIAAIREHHLANLGISRFAKFEWIYSNLHGREITDEESRELGDKFSAITMERILACPMVAGAAEALATLVGRYPLFVASGTPQDELDRVVEGRNLGSNFTEVWGSPTKKPVILADIAKRHGLSFEQILFIGDGTTDHEASVATGCHFLARITPDFADHWQALDVRRVHDLSGLAEMVAHW